VGASPAAAPSQGDGPQDLAGPGLWTRASATVTRASGVDVLGLRDRAARTVEGAVLAARAARRARAGAARFSCPQRVGAAWGRPR
jgi:hypothetical protein